MVIRVIEFEVDIEHPEMASICGVPDPTLSRPVLLPAEATVTAGGSRGISPSAAQ